MTTAAAGGRKLAWLRRTGRLPPAEAVACADCGDDADEWHHHHGYEPEHLADVVPLCFRCHRHRHRNGVALTPDEPSYPLSDPGPDFDITPAVLDEPHYSVGQIARKLNAPRHLVYRLLDSHRGPESVRVGRRRWVARAEFDAWLRTPLADAFRIQREDVEREGDEFAAASLDSLVGRKVWP